jgi:serine/threonine protein kinase
VCEALQVAHARGVVHRDLKPSNLILVADDPGSVTLLDFGVARSLSNQPLTRTGMVVGTVGYMAPEQALGEVDLDARADVFALGCLIYECLTCQPAFGGRHTVAVLAKMLSGEPPRLADREPRLAAFDPLLQRLLARDKAARPRDAGEVLEALDSLSPLARKLRRITPLVTRAAVSERERKLVSVLLCQRADGQNLDLAARASRSMRAPCWAPSPRSAGSPITVCCSCSRRAASPPIGPCRRRSWHARCGTWSRACTRRWPRG